MPGNVPDPASSHQQPSPKAQDKFDVARRISGHLVAPALAFRVERARSSYDHLLPSPPLVVVPTAALMFAPNCRPVATACPLNSDRLGRPRLTCGILAPHARRTPMTLAGPLGSDMPPIALRLGWLSLGSVGAHIPEVIQSIVEAGSQPKAMPISHWVCWRLWRGLATCRAWSGHRHRRRPLPTRRCHPCQKMRCSATWLALGGDMVLDCQLSAFALDVGGSLLERLVCYCLVAILVAPRLLRAGRKVFRPDWCTFARRHGAFMARMPPFGCPCSLPLFRVCSSCCLLLAPMSLGHVRLFPPYILPSDRGPCGAPVVCWFGSRRIWLLVAMSSCGGFPAFSKLLQHRQRRRQPPPHTSNRLQFFHRLAVICALQLYYASGGRRGNSLRRCFRPARGPKHPFAEAPGWGHRWRAQNPSRIAPGGRQPTLRRMLQSMPSWWLSPMRSCSPPADVVST